MMSLEKSNIKTARKMIKEHFKYDGKGFTYCPYIICGGDKDPHTYYSQDLWLAICGEFIDEYAE